jgi:hypothetical protein
MQPSRRTVRRRIIQDDAWMGWPFDACVALKKCRSHDAGVQGVSRKGAEQGMSLQSDGQVHVALFPADHTVTAASGCQVSRHEMPLEGRDLYVLLTVSISSLLGLLPPHCPHGPSQRNQNWTMRTPAFVKMIQPGRDSLCT